MHASSEQFYKLNYVESGLSRLCGGQGGNSRMRIYDVTSWSYVNLDDPQSKIVGAGPATILYKSSIQMCCLRNRIHHMLIGQMEDVQI